jgi:hypothetical protein
MTQKKKSTNKRKTPVARPSIARPSHQATRPKHQQSVSLDDVLEVIDTHMLTSQSGDLYDILTALRGPDTNDTRFNDLKIPITTIVRYAVCKKSKAHFKGLIENDTEQKAKMRVDVYSELRHTHGHFLDHAKAAFHALGLSWDKVNDINPGRKGYVIQYAE